MYFYEINIINVLARSSLISVLYYLFEIHKNYNNKRDKCDVGIDKLAINKYVYCVYVYIFVFEYIINKTFNHTTFSNGRLVCVHNINNYVYL